MAVTTPPPPSVEIDNGVIEEARRRQRRRRLGVAGLIALGAITATVFALALGGGGNRGHVAPPPYGPLHLTFVDGRPYLNGQLFPIAVRPGIDAQLVGLDVATMVGGGASAYPERGTPLFGGYEATPRPVAGHGEVVYFLTERQVAAVRVPGIGTFTPVALPGLPSGIRVIVFYRPPGARGTIFEPDAKDAGFPQPPAIVPIALNAQGRPITATEPPSVGITLRTKFWQHNTSVPASGLCALESRAAGARVQFGEVVTRITTPDYWAVGPAFITCVASWYVLPGGQAFQAALLLNAQHPGAAPAPLWGAGAVPGHPGLVDLKPVMGRRHPLPAPVFSARQVAALIRRLGKTAARRMIRDAEAYAKQTVVTLAPRMLARREGNAWLVVANGTLAQEIAFLNTLRATRLDLARR